MEIDNNILNRLIEISTEYTDATNSYKQNKELSTDISDHTIEDLYDIVKNLQHDNEMDFKSIDLLKERLLICENFNNNELYNLYYKLSEHLINEQYEDAELVKEKIKGM